jgi:hypothetical protein
VRRTARFGRARLTVGIRSAELRKRTFVAGLGVCALVATASPAMAEPEPTPTDASTGSVTPDPSTAKVDPEPTPTDAPTDPDTETPTDTPTPTPTATAPPKPAPKPTATPLPTPSPTKKPLPSLYVALTLPNTAVRPGDTITGGAHVYATSAVAKGGMLTVSATRSIDVTKTCTLSGTDCSLTDVDATGDVVPLRLVIPSTVKEGTVVLTATVKAKASSARNAKVLTKTVKHTFTVTSAAPAGGTTTTPPPAGTTPPSFTGPQVANSANSQIPTPAAAGQASLPQIAPSTSAPGVYPPLAPAQKVAALRADTGSDRQLSQLAKIQAVWLAGLLAAFSLLFNQLRPHRKNLGTHRRRGKGTFAR